jgi:hypothetical protein
MNQGKRVYQVFTERVDAHGSITYCKDAEITLDTDVQNRDDAFNPAELLLAALSACIIKGIERVAPMIGFSFRGLEVGSPACARIRRRKWNPSIIKSWLTPTSRTAAWNCCTTM